MTVMIYLALSVPHSVASYSILNAAHLVEIILEVNSISVNKQERNPMTYMNCLPVGLGEGRDIWCH